MTKMLLSDYNVNIVQGDFVGRDKIIYGDVVHGDKNVVNSAEEVPLSPEELRSLLAQYRQQVVADTRYLRLEGIPLPDADLTSAIPLQRVYIHIQVLEQRQNQEFQRAEEQALLASSTDREQARDRPDLFALIRRLGEYQYRRGQSIESNQHRTPADPVEAIGQHKHLVLLGAPGAGKSTLLRYVAHQHAEDDQGKVAIFVPLGAFALAHRQNRRL